MTRTIANALLVAALAFAVPAYSSVEVFLKRQGVDGESKDSKSATPGKDLKNNEAPKPAEKRVPPIKKAQEAPKPAAKTKGNVDYGWKVEQGEK